MLDGGGVVAEPSFFPFHSASFLFRMNRHMKCSVIYYGLLEKLYGLRYTCVSVVWWKIIKYRIAPTQLHGEFPFLVETQYVTEFRRMANGKFPFEWNNVRLNVISKYRKYPIKAENWQVNWPAIGTQWRRDDNCYRNPKIENRTQLRGNKLRFIFEGMKRGSWKLWLKCGHSLLPMHGRRYVTRSDECLFYDIFMVTDKMWPLGMCSSFDIRYCL